MLTSDGLVTVPLTKSDIFQDPVLTLPEKRMLMKFITSMAPFAGSLAFQSAAHLGVDQARKVPKPAEEMLEGGSDSATAIPGLEDTSLPWEAFLQRQKLSPRLCDFLTYAICLWDYAQGDGAPRNGAELSTEEGLRCLGRFVSSLGMHSRTGMPLLYPMYGSSEVAQGFTRMCALHRGTYALRTSATQLLAAPVAEGEGGGYRVAGIVTQRGEVVRAGCVVASCDHLLQRGLAAGSGDAAAAAAPGAVCRRMTVLTDSPLLQEEGLNLCVVPPRAADPPLGNVVQVLQLDWATGSCPRGYNVVHLSQAGHSSDAAAEDDPKLYEDLERALQALLAQSKGGPRSCLLRCAYLHRPRGLGSRWDPASDAGRVLQSCAEGRSLEVSADPAAVPQLLAAAEVSEARALFLRSPAHAEALAGEDFLRKPEHVAREEQGDHLEELAAFNEQMQDAARGGEEAPLDLSAHQAHQQDF